jgi:hypothetical protein
MLPGGRWELQEKKKIKYANEFLERHMKNHAPPSFLPSPNKKGAIIKFDYHFFQKG